MISRLISANCKKINEPFKRSIKGYRSLFKSKSPITNDLFERKVQLTLAENSNIPNLFKRILNSFKKIQPPQDFYAALDEIAVTRSTSAPRKYIPLSASKQAELKGKTFRIKSDIFNEQMSMTESKQGQLNTCYILSSIYALSHSPNPNAQKLLKARVKKNLDGSYSIIFSKRKKTIRVTNYDLNDKIQTQGDKGLQVMEAAYGKLRKLLFPAHYTNGLRAADYGNPSQFFEDLTGGKTFKITNNFNYDTAGIGFSFSEKIKILKQKLSEAMAAHNTNIAKGIKYDIEVNKKKCRQIIRLFNEIATEPGKYALTALSKMKSVTTYKVDGLSFYSAHAYTIQSADKANRKVTLINPHDTTADIVMSYDTFLKAFSEIDALIIPK